MADINFWARLSNLWSGFISLWIADVEKNHPEIAYENAIRGMIEKYARLKSATAAIIRRRDDVTARLEHERKELAQVEVDLQAALATNQDDLSLVLIEKRTALNSEIDALSEELNQAKADADDAKASLLAVKAEVSKLKAEKDRMLAKMKSAQARLAIQDQLEGLSVDADVRALDTVREHIKNTVSEANLGTELRESDLDQRLTSLRHKSGSITARSELDALKAARAQQAAQTQKKL